MTYERDVFVDLRARVPLVEVFTNKEVKHIVA